VSLDVVVLVVEQGYGRPAGKGYLAGMSSGRNENEGLEQVQKARREKRANEMATVTGKGDMGTTPNESTGTRVS
jgi:hypothetical protein